MIYAIATRTADAILRLRAVFGNGDWRERLVLASPPAPCPVWLHAASVGELRSASVLIDALASDPGIFITTNSTTGRDLAQGWGLNAQLAPFDSPGAVVRLLAAVRPAVQVTVEGEFWPNRSHLLARAGVAQVMIGARMSARSARRWARLQGVIAPMLGRITALSAQDAASEARLLALGLRDDAVLKRINLKLLDPARITMPQPATMRDLTFLAASTHDGEDAAVIDGWVAARQRAPDLRLILAPRHPERAGAVAALLSAKGIAFDRRSEGADETVAVLLADTLGEMDRWYRASGICLTGGSLVPRGGHTPWEPAGYGCAILHGPHVDNAAESYAVLDGEGAARAVSAENLGETLGNLAADPQAARAMGLAARAALDRLAGDPAPLIDRIRSLAKPH